MQLITDLAWVNNKSSQADTDSEWQWHQLGHMQVCTSLQTDNHASTPPLSFLQAIRPSCRPTNSVKALKELSQAKQTLITNDDIRTFSPPQNREITKLKKQHSENKLYN